MQKDNEDSYSSSSYSYNSDIDISIISEGENEGGENIGKKSTCSSPTAGVCPGGISPRSEDVENSPERYYAQTDGSYDSVIIKSVRRACSVPTEFMTEYLADAYAVKYGVEGHGDCLFLTFTRLFEDLDDRLSADILRRVAVKHVTENIARGTALGREYLLQLEEDVGEYRRRMARPGEWGGALEVLALARELGVQVVCFNVINNKEIVFNSFEEELSRASGRPPALSVMVLFTGVHYDPLFITDGCNTLKRFSPLDQTANKLAHDFTEAERRAGRYVDTSNPDWKLCCLTCGKIFGCKNEAAEHLQLTGHDTFGPANGGMI